MRINGVIIPELTKLVEDYAKTWVNLGGYYAQKQCIFFIQDDIHILGRKLLKNSKIYRAFESGKEYDAIYSDMEKNIRQLRIYLLNFSF